MNDLCTMCEEAPATTTWGFPVCQSCADMLTMLDADLKTMEAGEPALKVAGERVEEAARRFFESKADGVAFPLVAGEEK